MSPKRTHSLPCSMRPLLHGRVSQSVARIGLFCAASVSAGMGLWLARDRMASHARSITHPSSPLPREEWRLPLHGEAHGSDVMSTWSSALCAANDPPEDGFFYVPHSSSGRAAFLVFDGHGGPHAMHLAAKTLSERLRQEFAQTNSTEEALRRAMSTTEEMIMSRSGLDDSPRASLPSMAKSGTCVVAGVLEAGRGDQHGILTVGWLGDARAVVGAVHTEGNGKSTLRTVPLTHDHNAREPDEQLQLERAHPGEKDIVVRYGSGAHYTKGRLQLTRSLGDAYLKHERINRRLPSEIMLTGHLTFPYVLSAPDVRTSLVDRTWMFLVLGTDGLFDVMADEDVVREVGQFLTERKHAVDRGSTSKIPSPARHLVDKAVRRYAQKLGLTPERLMGVPQGRLRRSLHDDITATVVIFTRPGETKAPQVPVSRL